MPERKTYQITKRSTGGNIVEVTATAGDDGSLTIYDLSYGPAADAFYGEGRDVEVWLKLTAENVARFGKEILGDDGDRSADALARRLAERHNGENKALRLIQAQLDELGIPYEKDMWP